MLLNDYCGAKRYRIEIGARLSGEYLALLGDYCEHVVEERVFIEGLVKDQSELVGLIQKLFSLHISIVSLMPVDG